MKTNHHHAQVVFHRLLQLQRRSRHLAKAAEVELSASESFALSFIEHYGALAATQIADHLRIDVTTCIRLMQRLEKRRLVARAAREDGSRLVPFVLEPRGKSVLHADIELRAQAMDKEFVSLSTSQRKRLAALLDLFADNLGAPPGIRLLGEIVVRSPMRRLTAELGMLGRRFLGTDASALQHHVLQVLALFPHQLPLPLLLEVLPFEESAVSRMVSELVEEKWLTVTPSTVDSRSIEISVTSKFYQSYARLLAEPLDRVRAAVASFSARQIDELCELLSLVLDVSEGPALDTALRMKKIASARELNRGRVFVVRQLLESDAEPVIPEEILPQSDECFMLTQGDRLLAVLSVREGGVKYEMYDPLLRDSPLAEAFRRTVLGKNDMPRVFDQSLVLLTKNV